MRTVLTTDVDEAAGFIKAGGVVAFPTETVYGLGANVFDDLAVSKIFAAKRRPADNPLIAHVDSVDKIKYLAAEITVSAERFIERFFPGPLTLVLKKTDAVPMIATAGLDSIGVRMPRADLAHRFLVACGVPLVAPSANLSGRPSPTTWQAVLEDLDGSIDCILQGDDAEIGLESTVVDCTGDVPLLLRAGAVSLAELQAVVPATISYKPAANERPKSPGVLHRHYSPSARVELVTDATQLSRPKDAAYIGLKQTNHKFLLERICVDAAEYAHAVFEFFRECDRLGIPTIYCEQVPETGIGVALMDRLRRAAER